MFLFLPTRFVARYAALIHQHFVLALLKAFVNFFRLPLKLFVRLMAAPALLVILASLLGSPFFVARRVQADLAKFTYHQNLRVLSLLGVVHVAQALLAPVWIVVLLAQALFPWIVWAVFNSSCPDGIASGLLRIQPHASCWSMFFSNDLTQLINAAPTWVWVLVVVWTLLAMSPTLWFLNQFLTKHVLMFHPVSAAVWLYYRLVTKGVWMQYKNMFVACVQVCYEHRRGCLYWGEIAIIPCFALWTVWPISIPFVVAATAGGMTHMSWLAFGLLCAPTLYFMFAARSLLRQFWADERRVSSDVCLAPRV